MNTTVYLPPRRKRDSPDNLYRQCQITGNCPPDVKNKIEGTTLADKLLKIFGSIVYFGGLGIGSGKGSGGSTGYRPLVPESPAVTPGTVVRPAVPVELGPPDILPTDPAIVQLGEGGLPGETIDPSVFIENAGTDTAAGGENIELSVLTEVDPVSEVGGSEGHPTIITGIDDSVAVLEVTPSPPPPKRVALDVRPPRLASTPHISVVSSSADTTLSSDINIFVDAQGTGDSVAFGEEIPLEPLSRLEEFEIAEGGSQPRTSTPRDALQRVVQRARQYYNRRVQQVQTRAPEFLSRPSELVQFGFDNPAYDPEVTLTFQQDVEAVAAAPDTDFTDVVRLQRPTFAETDSGHVRVSRLGQRGTISTRSGLQIGQHVHFYYDLSTIGPEPTETIELSTLGEHSGDSVIFNGIVESSFVNPISSATETYTEDELLDPLIESFENSHLVLSGSSRRTTYTVPTIPPGAAVKVFIDDVGEGLLVSYPVTHSTDNTTYPYIPVYPPPVDPTVISFDLNTDEFIIHPSVLRRRRKRKRSDSF